MANFENSLEYFESWAKELSSKADRIRCLIGDRHWLTDGQHKEAIVKEFLQRYVPQSLTIGSGFIKNRKSNLCSPEIDILISDQSITPSYFNECGIQILSPTSVVAYIEMKSTLNSSALKKAFSSIEKSQKALGNNKKSNWRGICFCSIQVDFDKFNLAISSQVRRVIEQHGAASAEQIIESLPVCVTSFNEYVVFVKCDNTRKKVVLNSFNFGAMSAAIAFGDLFDFISSYNGANDVNDISEILTDMDPINYKKITLDVNND